MPLPYISSSFSSFVKYLLTTNKVFVILYLTIKLTVK